MKTAEALSRKLETLNELREVTRTMKALASSSVRQYEHAVEALDEYFRTVELGLHVVLGALPGAPPSPSPPPRQARLAAVVFGTDYGLCGRFNQAICEHAVAHLDATGIPPGNRLLLAVGGKVSACLEQAGQVVQECLFTPGSAEAITDTVSSILLTIDSWKEEHGVEQVWLFYNRHAGKARYQPESLHLLPVDAARFRRAREAAWPTRMLPTFSMAPAALLAALVRQYLFVSLFRACAESLASEHNARLVAMQAAGKNIDEAIEETRTEHRRLRQELITTEILDVTTGYQASAGGGGDIAG